jgi:hypothetical protein
MDLVLVLSELFNDSSGNPPASAGLSTGR